MEMQKTIADKKHVRDEAYVLRQVLRYRDECSRKQDGDEKPFLDYSRYVRWNYEPCEFCGNATEIHEVGGRYVHCDMDENFEAIEGTLITFCGDCLQVMEKYFDGYME